EEGPIAAGRKRSKHAAAPASPARPAQRPRARGIGIPRDTSPPPVDAGLLTPCSSFTGNKVQRANLPSIEISGGILTDGNCLFAAISQHLMGTQQKHLIVRKRAIEYLGKHLDMLDFAAEGDDHVGRLAYLDEMAKPGTYGDEVMLAAACATYNTSALVVMLHNGKYHTRVYPDGAQPPHMGLFYFEGLQHYELALPLPKETS
ncbi:hypothetical protein IE81DRAFT_332679, partial [Ceraceosorus guamensis]